VQKLSETLRRRLTTQGFACEVELVGQMAPWLRWTPALGAIWIAAGTTARSPAILWSFSLCAAAGAMGWHPFDALFNQSSIDSSGSFGTYSTTLTSPRKMQFGLRFDF